MAKEKRNLDIRTLDRYREKGLLTESEIQSHMKSLPDDANNCQWVQMDLHDTEMGEEASDDGSDE